MTARSFAGSKTARRASEYPNGNGAYPLRNSLVFKLVGLYDPPRRVRQCLLSWALVHFRFRPATQGDAPRHGPFHGILVESSDSVADSGQGLPTERPANRNPATWSRGGPALVMAEAGHSCSSSSARVPPWIKVQSLRGPDHECTEAVILMRFSLP